MVRATAQVVLLCVGVFLVQTLLSWLVGPAIAAWVFALSLPIGIQPWTIATSVYAHAGPAHLIGNLVLFALLGVILERQTSAGRLHAFVLVTGALAGVAQVYASAILFAQPGAAVLGLSGAVFAMLGYLVTGNRVTNGTLDRLGVPAWGQLVVFVLLAGFVTLWTASPGAALVGHFTGFLAGLLAGQENLLRVPDAELQARGVR